MNSEKHVNRRQLSLLVYFEYIFCYVIIVYLASLQSCFFFIANISLELSDFVSETKEVITDTENLDQDYSRLS